MSSRLTNIKTNVISHTFIIIQHIYNICANCLGIDVKVTFVSFIYLVSLFDISTAFLFFFFFIVEALVSNLLGHSKKSWSLARMSSRKRYKTIEGGLLQELKRASETHQ